MDDDRDRPKIKMPWLWIVIMAVFIFLLANISGRGETRKEVPASEIYAALENGKIEKLIIAGGSGTVYADLKDNVKVWANVVDAAALEKRAVEKGINVEVRYGSGWGDILLSFLPWVVILAVIYFLFWRPMLANRSGSNGVFDFGKSKAKLIIERPGVTFEDIAGCDEAKEEVKDLITYLENPVEYLKTVARPPRGVLFVGPPGTGKTMMAKAVANAAKAPFLSIRGSDFVEMFVGVGAARVRDLFATGRRCVNRYGRCVIFVDEINAIGARRHVLSTNGSNDERDQALHALLAEMDGFDSAEGLIVLAATNSPEVLDPALLRSGRFDSQIMFGLPDINGREAILKVHVRNVSLDPVVDLRKIASETPGASGADLENIINQAGRIAKRRGADLISQNDFYEAIDRVALGAKRNILLSSEDLERCAYHELGHTLVGYFLNGQSAVRKVTIIPRGLSLGATHFYHKEEYIKTEKNLKNNLAVALGGRVVEKMKFGDYSSGAASDLATATEIAKKMVCEWGMDNCIGSTVFGREETLFLGGRTIIECSEETKRIIEEAIKKLLEAAEGEAYKLLNENQGLLDSLFKELREKETLSGEMLNELIKNFESTKQ